MTTFSLEKITQILDGELYAENGSEYVMINSISIDSRTLVDVKACLFFALVGERHNGHRYVVELYKRGVRNFVVSQFRNEFKTLPHTNFILVADSLKALQQLAAYVSNKFSFPLLSITGSNGKTIVKEWLFDLLHKNMQVVRSPRSFNSQVGVPLSIWNIQGEADLGIIEAGISKPGEMDQLAAIIRPDFGMLTNIGDAHQENFNSIEQKLDEKLKLFDDAKLIVYCADSELINLKMNEKFSEKQLFSWSKNGGEADLPVEIRLFNRETLIHFNWNNVSHEIKFPFQDEASIENACHCLALIVANNWLSDAVLERFSNLQPVAMRLELKHGINSCTLINDFYNSDLNSLEIALQFMGQQSGSTSEKKTVILSDIQQSGLSPHQLYTEVNRLLKNNHVSRLIGIGRVIHDHESVFQLPASFYFSTKEFIQKVKLNDFKNETILIKGAREFQFENVASLLQKKYHQTQLEISLNALVENLNVFKARVKPDTKVMVMVKAFSYGSGTVEIARALEFQKVDYLAVAVTDEGIELRQAGVTVPIVVMNPEEHSFDAMLDYRLEPNIYSLALFQKFNKAARSAAVSFYPIHIKLETGMNRLGFSNEKELNLVLDQLRQEETLQVQSVFSHLAAADEPQHDAFTRQQFERFDGLSKLIVESQKHKVLRHLLNSAGIERFPEFQMDMVRLGIGLYGISAVSEKNIKPIARWTSTISQLKKVEEGETVGYGRKGQVSNPKQIAVVPVGYADGYDRRLSSGVGKMWVNGKLAPVIGHICMDMTMIDVSGIEVKAGNLVELMGDHIHLTELADWANTIPYEILTGISQRVKRIYSQE